jgi:predicted nuclease of predicted toxin-antitoxin system
MPVRFKFDEDLPAEIASLVSAIGHDAHTVFLQGHTGLPDEQLWPIVQSDQRILFTADKGFANARG